MGLPIEVLAALGAAASTRATSIGHAASRLRLDESMLRHWSPRSRCASPRPGRTRWLSFEASASDESLRRCSRPRGSPRWPSVHGRASGSRAISLSPSYIPREFSEAAQAAERSVALARRVESPLLPWALSVQAMANAEAGDLATATAALAECVKETVERDLPVQTGDSLLAAMPVARATGTRGRRAAMGRGDGPGDFWCH